MGGIVCHLVSYRCHSSLLSFKLIKERLLLVLIGKEEMNSDPRFERKSSKLGAPGDDTELTDFFVCLRDFVLDVIH